MDVPSEILSEDELAEIIGRKLVAKQREWLDQNGWIYVTNAAGRPIVGRLYTRMKLGGVPPTADTIPRASRINWAALDSLSIKKQK
ncbi:MAG: DUF4224 domain-containing protein [Betaproteobacteria bacterium]|nr:DUF4224 domain-containing protein [Betaproteobacteria bacterium]